MSGEPALVIGVISDTHGLLRPEATEAMQGAQLIVHAGDVGDPAILKELEKLAPVKAVRGNIDVEKWARKIPEELEFEAGGRRFVVLHDAKQYRSREAVDCVISGHSHVPLSQEKNVVLFFNPGSAGPRRFRLPVSVGRIVLRDGALEPELITLAVD